MKNLYSFLQKYSTCPICKKDIFTEIMVTFDAFTQRNAVPFLLSINYIRDNGHSVFKYVKYRDDDDKKYDPGFDRAATSAVISKDGSFMFDSNVFSPSSYIVYGMCTQDHFIVETKEVYINSAVEEHKAINIGREEFQIRNYRIINDYRSKKTKVYIDNNFPARLNMKLSPALTLTLKSPLESNASDIISKIESLLILT